MRRILYQYQNKSKSISKYKESLQWLKCMPVTQFARCRDKMCMHDVVMAAGKAARDGRQPFEHWAGCWGTLSLSMSVVLHVYYVHDSNRHSQYTRIIAIHNNFAILGLYNVDHGTVVNIYMKYKCISGVFHPTHVVHMVKSPYAPLRCCKTDPCIVYKKTERCRFRLSFKISKIIHLHGIGCKSISRKRQRKTTSKCKEYNHSTCPGVHVFVAY